MKRVLLVASLCAVLIMGTASCGKVQMEQIQNIDTVMGTIVSQSVYVTEESTVCTDINKHLQELEQQVLSWRVETSQVGEINASVGSIEGITLSSEMAEILNTCKKIATDSDGAFDITIGQVARMWDIDTWASHYNMVNEYEAGYVLPERTQIQEALAKTGYEKLILDKEKLILPDDMQLDLGAVGKGIALDHIHDYLQQCPEVCGAVISVGGSVLTYGSKSEGTESNPWKVGIVNPHNTKENIGYLMLQGQWCVSTSGDYERYVEVNGKRYHHIIDPSTGWPAESGVSSVTILTKKGLESDALSTACFILGVDEGLKLAQKYDAEVLFVDVSGEITMSDGMEQYFHLY